MSELFLNPPCIERLQSFSSEHVDSTYSINLRAIRIITEFGGRKGDNSVSLERFLLSVTILGLSLQVMGQGGERIDN